MSSFWVILALVPCVLGGLVSPQENEVFEGRSESGFDAFKLIADCRKTDFGTCLGIKAVTLMNRAARMDVISVFDGVTFVSSGDIDRTGRALSESELENSLPEESSQKTSRLFDLFLDAALRFFKSHTLQFKLPESAPAELQRAFEEGRGKLKKSLLPIVIGIAAKVFAIIPLALGGLALIATKALIIAKIAFVIAAVIGLQKLLGGGGGLAGLGKVTGSSGWNTGNSYSNTGGWSSSGGPYYRSFSEDDAQNMAYNAQAPKS